MKRTDYCGDLRAEHTGRRAALCGWAQTVRDHGGLIFIDLRDRTGVAQVVCDPRQAPAAHQAASQVRNEFVLAVEGEVALRPAGTENPALPTGQVEVRAAAVEVLNAARTPPFLPGEQVDEMLRLRHRYLDLRSPRMQRNLQVRAAMARAAREHLDAQGFWEIETPFLTKSTPEGARDYLVPCRLQPGKFYALPQSPQLFKQVLMVSGLERYYQLARCMRDEDLRADRQPEFTQIDLEMSFVDQEDVIRLCEELAIQVFKAAGVELPDPFPRLTYREAMDRFGSDKPDLRFGMELADLSDALRDSGFQVFARALQAGGVVVGMNARGCAGFSRRETDDLERMAREAGARGLAYLALDEQVRSPIAKFLSPAELEAIRRLLSAGQGDLILMVADQRDRAVAALGRVRLQLGEKLGLIPAGEFRALWVTDFPLFAWNEQEQRIEPMHHPFSSPREQDLPLLETDPLQVHGKLYDLVLNGAEIASGSIRIHRRQVQEKVFELIQLSEEQARERFGFLLEAFEYGAPPHGGIAFGFDRMVALAVGEESIREVIAFPKTAAATDPLTGAPSDVDQEQLRELGIALAESMKVKDEG